MSQYQQIPPYKQTFTATERGDIDAMSGNPGIVKLKREYLQLLSKYNDLIDDILMERGDGGGYQPRPSTCMPLPPPRKR